MSANPAELRSIALMARRYPGARGADASHPATWTRWILKGCIGADGRRHKLTATRFGARWMVTESAVEAFFTALTTPTMVAEIPSPIPARRAAAAAQELEELGA